MADDKNTDQEFEGFDNLDDAYADPSLDDAILNDDIDDAEFQDVAGGLDEDVFEEDPLPAATQKKKVNWFNIVIALVAVVAAGGLGVMKLAPQLLGGVPAAAPGPVVAGANTADNAEAAAQAALEPQPGSVTGGGMLDNPDAFAQLADGAIPAPMPADANNAIPDPFAATSALPSADSAAAQTAAANDVPMPAPITAEPAPMADAPESPVESPAESPIEAMPAVPAAPVTPVAAEATPLAPAPSTPAPDNTAVSALQGQVDTLSSRMNSIESKLDAALASATQVQSAAAPADDSRFDRIQSALERLESRLDDMASTRTQRATPVRADDEDRPAPVKKTTKKKTVPAKSKASGEWDEPYKPSAPTVVPATAPTSGNTGGWTLRGAQPGQAIIGEAGGDIRQVSVGDSVSGIGQVTGIAPINGRWVVQGTQGRISQ